MKSKRKSFVLYPFFNSVTALSLRAKRQSEDDTLVIEMKFLIHGLKKSYNITNPIMVKLYIFLFKFNFL